MSNHNIVNTTTSLKKLEYETSSSDFSRMKVDDNVKSNCKAEKIISFIIAMTCYGATLYMMIILYIKYADNLDSSQLSMKEFNKSPTGRYPSFTFCIYGEDGVMFDGKKLKKKYGVGKKEFYDFLSGEKEIVNLTKADIDFEEIILGMDEILHEFSVEDENYEEYNEWDTSMDVKNIALIPFISKYHDPTTNCFDYSTPYDPNISFHSLKLKFNITKFVEIFSEEAKMYLQAHYPGQLIRDMKTFLFKINDWHKRGAETKNNLISAQFAGVTVMRFRENAIEACNPDLIDDDAEWKQYVITKIGCSPVYWNYDHDNHQYHNEVKACTSSKELKKFQSYWPMLGGKFANGPFRHYTKPCTKMSLLNNINQMAYYGDPDILKVKFRMREAVYQEVLNNRGFGAADLWGNIGGYVGIFCGYSILQGAASLIDFLRILLTKLTRK